MEVARGATTQGNQLTQMNALIASGGSWYHPTLHLAQNNFTPGRNLTLAQLTEANFSGYTAVPTMAWQGAYVAEDGLVHVTGQNYLFSFAGGSVTNTIYGAYITDATNTILLAAGLIPTPIPLTTVNQGVDIAFDYPYGQ